MESRIRNEYRSEAYFSVKCKKKQLKIISEGLYESFKLFSFTLVSETSTIIITEVSRFCIYMSQDMSVVWVCREGGHNLCGRMNYSRYFQLTPRKSHVLNML